MYRFRKKSDARRARAIPVPAAALPSIDTILPPASDFRTSLILPSLTRRFTLLRTENGDPVSLQDMRERLAHRRFGGDIQLTEEEEDMVIEELGKARFPQSVTLKDQHAHQAEPGLPVPPLPEPFMTPLYSDPDGRSAGRSSGIRSNNIFGAHTEYLPRSQSGGSSSSTALATGLDIDTSAVGRLSPVTRMPRDLSPSWTTLDGSFKSDSKTQDTSFGSIPLSSPGSTSLTPSKSSRSYRLSVALEGILNELEGGIHQQPESPILDAKFDTTASGRARSSSFVLPAAYDGDTAGYTHLSNADSVRGDLPDINDGILRAAFRSRSLSPPPLPVAGDPSRRLPGYVPGMHRPITPKREIDTIAGPTSRSVTPPHRGLTPSPAPKGPYVHSLNLRRSSVTAEYPPITPVSGRVPVDRASVGSQLHLASTSVQQVSQSTPENSTGHDSSGHSEVPVNQNSYLSNSSPVAPLTANGRSNGQHDMTSSLLDDLRSSPLELYNVNEPDRVDITDRSSLLSSDLRRRLERRLSSPLRSSISRHARDGPLLSDDEPDSRRIAMSQALHSSASSGSSGPALGQLAFPGRLSSSSSSSSIGSSYHSSQEHLVTPRFGKSTVFSKNTSDVFPKWDTEITSGMGTNTHADAKSPTFDVLSYERALDVLSISEDDIYNIHARLTKLQSAITPKVGPLNGLVGARRTRRPSTPYSARSVLSGDDSEPGMATESTVTPSKAAPSSQPLLPAADPLPQVNVSSRVSHKDAMMTAMLEGLPGSQPITDGDSGVLLATTIALQSVSPETSRHREVASQQGSSIIKSNDTTPYNVLPITPETSSSALHFPLPEQAQRVTERSRYPVNDSQLLLDVERKANAATAALKKSPSLPKLGEKGLMGRKSVKKIDLNQISSPQLLPSIPDDSPRIPVSPSMTSIPTFDKTGGGLFRRFRSVGKSKSPVVTDDDHRPPSKTLRPFPASDGPVSSQPVSPPVFSAPTNGSTNDLQHWRFPSPTASTPPTSASPQAGLKGLISRLRKTKREAETEDHRPSARGDNPILMPVDPRRAPRSPPTLTRDTPRLPPQLEAADGRRVPVQSAQASSEVDSGVHPGKAQEDIRKLYEAATDLGLDKAAVNDLLVRSRSTSSRTTEEPRSALSLNPPVSSRAADLGRSTSLATSSARLSPHGFSMNASGQKVVSLPQTQASHLVTSSEGPSQVVRRTLIYPTLDGGLSAEQFEVLRRSVSAHSRAGSAGSQISVTKSIRDRIPTPPPTRAAARRLSGGPSPPLPPLPQSVSARTRNVQLMTRTSETHHASISEVPSSVINSASELPLSTARPVDEDGRLPQDAGLQMLELSNGQVIWSVVDGLRAGLSDDFDEDDRSSFTSDFSVAPPSRDEAVQLFIRGHQRNTSSKGSGVSYASRRKTGPLNARPRPETKIYFSSSAQISSLIEGISRGLESGSFDIVPSDPMSPYFPSSPPPRDRKYVPALETMSSALQHARPSYLNTSRAPVSDEPQTGHAHHASLPSVDSTRWTMEERLEHVLMSVHSAGDNASAS